MNKIRNFLFIIMMRKSYIIIKRKLIKKIMIAPYFPAIFVPIVGIFLPGLAMAALFIYIEKESVE
jgi:photosystem I reaction center subunit VIII